MEPLRGSFLMAEGVPREPRSDQRRPKVESRKDASGVTNAVGHSSRARLVRPAR